MLPLAPKGTPPHCPRPPSAHLQVGTALIQLDLQVVELVPQDFNGVVLDLHLLLELTGASAHLLDLEILLH